MNLPRTSFEAVNQKLRKRVMTGLALSAWMAMAPAAFAQTVAINPLQTKVVGGANLNYGTFNFVTSVQIITSGGVSDLDPVNLAVSGAPAGVTASLSQTTITNNATTTITLSNNLVNVAKGTYPLTISASGAATGSNTVTLVVGELWRASDVNNTNWTTAANWSTGVIPGSTGEVKIEEPVVRNMFVDQNFAIESFTFMPTNSNIDDMSLNLGSNTLTIKGTNGFYMGSELSENRPRLTVMGTGSLIVSNQNANFAQNNLTGAGNQGQLWMTNLNTFVANVNRFGIGDASLIDRGGRNAQRTLTALARTNIIKAGFTGNYTGLDFETSIQFFKNQPFNNGQTFEANLGIWNEFYGDSLGVGMGRAGNDANILRFNPVFTNALPKPYARFRNTDGASRMTLVAAGVDAGASTVNSSDRGRIDLRGGIADMLVDTIWLGVNRSNVTVDANASLRGRLFVNDGTVDANVIRAGYQKYSGDAICQGFLQVDGTGLLVVNDYIELGFASGNSPTGAGTYAQAGFGQISMTGGEIRARSITVGPITFNNTITMNSGAKLVISNTVADPAKKLTTLNMSDSTLTLHINGTNTNPYVYVTNLLTGGAGNTIQIASVTNLSSFPTQVALISYESATPNFAAVLPPGLFGALTNDTVNKRIDLLLSTSPPRSLRWVGNINGNWDTSTSNWVDTATSLSTTFNNGDFVRFDDTATGPTTVTVIGTIIPGQSPATPGTIVSNSVKNYTFTGGTISGTGSAVKQGTGALTINTTHEPPLIVSNGTATVTASGLVGLTTVRPGVTFTSSGTVGGLTSSGTSSSAGTINGPVAIQAGTFVNSGTANTAPGAMTIAAGTQVTNTSSGVLNVGGGNWSVDAGAVLANFGQIRNLNGRLNVNGTLIGTGVVTDPDGYTIGVDGRLSVNSGATFSPGASIGTFFVEGRFDLNQNARLVIEVDLNHPATNDVVGVDVFGNIRGIIVMTNIGAVPFAAGQSFLVVSNNFGPPNVPLNPNLDFSFEPASPGLGMVWDRSDLATNGIVKISAITATPTNINFTVSSNQMTLTWPPSHLGWLLQTQVRALTNGISPFATNWTTVADSQFTNQVIVTINPNNPAVFYRLAHP